VVSLVQPWKGVTSERRSEEYGVILSTSVRVSGGLKCLKIACKTDILTLNGPSWRAVQAMN